MLPCILYCKLSGKDSFRGFMFDEIGLMMNKSIVFTGGKKETADTEVRLGIAVDDLVGNSLFANGLHVAYAPIGLECRVL